MPRRHFRELIENKWSERKFVSVGLDSADVKLMMDIVKSTHDLVAAYKINTEFYSGLAIDSQAILRTLILFINAIAPTVPVILDRKAGDIGNTNLQTANTAFRFFEADAITVNPYLGEESLFPFLTYPDKGIFVLCRTSNPASDEFQNLDVIALAEDEARWSLGPGDNLESWPLKLYEYIAFRVSHDWNKNGNCGLVVGATNPEDLERVRDIVGNMPILIPGIGAQGGNLAQSVKAGKNERGKGMIINSSRGVIFASRGPDQSAAARNEVLKMNNQIKQSLSG